MRLESAAREIPIDSTDPPIGELPALRYLYSYEDPYQVKPNPGTSCFVGTINSVCKEVLMMTHLLKYNALRTMAKLFSFAALASTYVTRE